MDAVSSHTIACFDDDAGRNILNYLEKIGSDLNNMSEGFDNTRPSSKYSLASRVHAILLTC